RFSRDWSSDVCSSDLRTAERAVSQHQGVLTHVMGVNRDTERPLEPGPHPIGPRVRIVGTGRTDKQPRHPPAGNIGLHLVSATIAVSHLKPPTLSRVTISFPISSPAWCR